MDSLSSNFKATLPPNVEEDPELLDHFKDAALSITSLFKYSQQTRKRAFGQGYNACVTDLLEFIQSYGKDGESVQRGALTVGSILDYLESRQIQLVSELERTSVSSTASKSSHQADLKRNPKSSPTPPVRSRTTSSTRQKSPPDSPETIKQSSPTIRSMQPPSSPRPHLPPSPSTSPTQVEGESNFSTSWPEVSILSSLPALQILPFPTLGSKRKREVLSDVDLVNGRATADSRAPSVNHRKKKGRSHNSYATLRLDDKMDTEEEGRERKRVARR